MPLSPSAIFRKQAIVIACSLALVPTFSFADTEVGDPANYRIEGNNNNSMDANTTEGVVITSNGDGSLLAPGSAESYIQVLATNLDGIVSAADIGSINIVSDQVNINTTGTGSTTIGGDFTGDITLKNGASSLVVTDSGTAVTGTLSSTGIANTGNIGTATLSTTGAATVGGTLDVRGVISNTTGNVTITDNLDVTGTLTQVGSTSLTGTTAINTTGIETTTIGSASAGNITLQSGAGSSLVVGDTGTAVTGTLSSTGNFSVGANTFTVEASTGNTLVGGTLGVTGQTTTAGIVNTGTLDNTGAFNQTGASTLIGTTNINATGTDATNIGTAGGATNIGSSASTNTVLGTTSVTGITNINTTGSLGTNIGNANSTTTVLGTTSINATGNGNTTIGTVGASGSTNQILGLNNTITATGINAITGATNNINGVTNINASISSATNINTGTSTSAVTIGNTTASATNTVNAYSGNTTLSLSNNTASLTAGSTLATNGITGNTSGANSGGLTVYNSAQTIAAGTTIPTTLSPTGILTGKTYQNLINGNLLVDGNLYINGTLDYVSSNTANTTVIGSTTGVGASILNGATEATNGGTAIVLKGATGTQTVVDANGKLTNVVGTATQSTAALTLTNGIGNTHGLVITETQATLSGGTRSSSLTMGDNGATFSDSATGAPVQVHGVNDGTSDFDAVNVRQFSSAIASVTAMANIPQVDQDKTVAVGMAMGSFMGRTALAAGMTYRFTKNGVLKGSISSALNSSKSTAVGLGAAWSY